MSKTIIAIDPGLAGTGIAIFEGNTLQYCKSFSVNKTGKTIVERCEEYCCKIDDVIYNGGILYSEDIVIYIEDPCYMGSGKGIVCAESGGLVKLVFYVGYISKHLISSGYRIKPISIQNWKGNLSKEIIKKRIKNVLSIDVCKNKKVSGHSWDAVGIAMYKLGLII